MANKGDINLPNGMQFLGNTSSYASSIATNDLSLCPDETTTSMEDQILDPYMWKLIHNQFHELSREEFAKIQEFYIKFKKNYNLGIRYVDNMKIEIELARLMMQKQEDDVNLLGFLCHTKYIIMNMKLDHPCYTLMCTICGISYKKLYAFRKHLATHSIIINEGVPDDHHHIGMVFELLKEHPASSTDFSDIAKKVLMTENIVAPGFISDNTQSNSNINTQPELEQVSLDEETDAAVNSILKLHDEAFLENIDCTQFDVSIFILFV